MPPPNPPQRPTAPWSPPPGGRPNTVGLHERELGELLDRFDAPEDGRPDPRRGFVRWPFRRTSVQMKLTHPSGAITTINVACRNISRGGLSALHNAYLHPGTKCKVVLPHPGDGHRILEGQVVRCTHRAGVIHEIGIAFKDAIDVRDFVRPDPLADCFSLERVNPDELTGTVLFVEPSEIDRRIFRHFLRGTPLKVSIAESADEALGLLDDACELIVLDLAIARDRAFVNTLRERATVPIIVTSSDTSPEVREIMRTIGAEAFIAKPLTQRGLLRAVAEFLIVRRTAKAARAAVSLPDDVVPHLAQNFLSGLPDYAERIQEAIRRDDAAACRNLCLQIAGTAPAVGFKPLGRLAAAAAQLLSRSQSVPASLHAVRSLVAACERATNRAA
ncbi:MAG: response regulator [Phycisphaerales bacterium]